MSEDSKLKAVKEAVEAAKKRASQTVSTVMPESSASDNSDNFLSCLSRAHDSILQTLDESSPEARLYFVSLTLIRVCDAIQFLAICPALTHIEIRGVTIDSIVKSKSAKKAATAVNTSKKFLNLSAAEESHYFIDNAITFINSSLTTLSSISPKEKETMVELANAFMITCSAILSSALEVTLLYSCGDDCVCEKHKLLIQ